MKLIVVNYSISPKSLIFSHQREVVLALAPFFEAVDVFTTETSLESLPNNVKVFLVPWKPQSPIRNIVTILKFLYPAIYRARSSVLFSHMTDIHAAIVAPLTWLLRMRHTLWYAHAKNSRYLIWASFFVTKVVSSTPGSCNLNFNKKKIVYINQGIRGQNFPYHKRSREDFHNILYYGRLDPSKNIHLFPNLIDKLNRSQKTYRLAIFGKPGNEAAEKYLEKVAAVQEIKSQELPITFNGPIVRDLIPDIAEQHGTFLNLFSGSLDKTLIEATLMGMPVVTWNKEYCSQFGTWSGVPVSEDLEFIIQEFRSIESFKATELNKEINKRLHIANMGHTLEGWIDRLIGILREGVSE